MLEGACQIGYIAEQDYERLNEETIEICKMKV